MPFVNEQQRRACYAKAREDRKKGKTPKWNCKKWELKGGAKNSPANPQLYNRVKAAAKRKFKVWPSAYASAWLVREYKKRGGKYKSKGKKSTSRSRRSSSSGLQRWFKEKWINVCKLPKRVSCGRPKTSVSNWKKTYPYCRPSRRVNKSTPKTAQELSKEEIRRRCRRKRKTPLKKIGAKSRRRSPSSTSRSRRSRRKRSTRRRLKRSTRRRSPSSTSRSRRSRSRRSRRKRSTRRRLKRSTRRRSPSSTSRSRRSRSRRSGRSRRVKNR